MKLLTFSCIALGSVAIIFSFQSNKLVITPNSIECGQSATLAWKVKGGSNVYISNIGGVPAQGIQSVSPKETTTYVLVADGASGHELQKVQLNVSKCSRGDDEFPTDFNRFQHPVTINPSIDSLSKFLAHVHKVLQDDMGFSVKEFQNQDGQFVFITKLSIRSHLVRQNEKRIGSRRISYLITINKNSIRDGVTCTIKTLIEYRRRVEGTWRLETNEEFYNEESNKLRQRVDGLR
jgi:hypothetical protein